MDVDVESTRYILRQYLMLGIKYIIYCIIGEKAPATQKPDSASGALRCPFGIFNCIRSVQSFKSPLISMERDIFVSVLV